MLNKSLQMANYIIFIQRKDVCIPLTRSKAETFRSNDWGSFPFQNIPIVSYIHRQRSILFAIIMKLLLLLLFADRKMCHRKTKRNENWQNDTVEPGASVHARSITSDSMCNVTRKKSHSFVVNIINSQTARRTINEFL